MCTAVPIPQKKQGRFLKRVYLFNYIYQVYFHRQIKILKVSRRKYLLYRRKIGLISRVVDVCRWYNCVHAWLGKPLFSRLAKIILLVRPGYLYFSESFFAVFTSVQICCTNVCNFVTSYLLKRFLVWSKTKLKKYQCTKLC